MPALTDIVLSIAPVNYVVRNACEYIPLAPLFEDKGICSIDAEQCAYCTIIRQEYHCFKTTQTRLPLLNPA